MKLFTPHSIRESFYSPIGDGYSHFPIVSRETIFRFAKTPTIPEKIIHLSAFAKESPKNHTLHDLSTIKFS